MWYGTDMFFVLFLDTSDSHLTLQQRKTAVSDWLKSVVEDVILKEVLAGGLDEPKKVFSYLTGYQLPEACQAAQNKGKY